MRCLKIKDIKRQFRHRRQESEQGHTGQSSGAQQVTPEAGVKGEEEVGAGELRREHITVVAPQTSGAGGCEKEC